MNNDFHHQPTLIHDRPLPLPKKIGPYEIESLLSRGGMSALYLATHPNIPHPLVVKVLLPKYSKDKEIASRFLNEAQIIGMTNHPNIIRLYGQGKWEKGLYIAMEFVQGISLRQFIQQKSLSHKRALEIILQVAYALSHLHSHGVIHRDLKPENILITETGEIKVIDFGIAQLHTDLEQERITQQKRLMGTPIYMSPEQKQTPLDVSYSSDIYSLGIVAYELILGRLSHGVIHLSLLPRTLRSILEKMLKENPKERYQDIIECINDLSQYLKVTSDHPLEKEEAHSEEILAMIQEAHSLLLPKKPTLPPLDIALATQEGPSLTSFYLDSFPNTLLLAQPLNPKPAALFHLATLRALAHAILPTHKTPLLALQALSEHPIPQTFALCLIHFASDHFTFVSCAWPPLWRLSQNQLHSLTTANPPFGTPPTLETSDTWLPGDRLLLSSHLLTEPAILATAHLSPQSQADNLLPSPPSLVLILHN